MSFEVKKYWGFFQIVYWHEVESRDSSPDIDLDKHLERQYVQRKLFAGLARIWQDVQVQFHCYKTSYPLLRMQKKKNNNNNQAMSWTVILLNNITLSI